MYAMWASDDTQHQDSHMKKLDLWDTWLQGYSH